MTTYFIRKTGADANAGTSAGAAWLTIGKALGASGIASGDTVYIGAGIYREVTTVTMTSAVAETKIIGDVDGVQTGDPGEVILSGFLTNDHVTSSGSSVIDCNARDFLTFQRLIFTNGQVCLNVPAGSTNITAQDCAFVPMGNVTTISVVVTVDTAATLLIQRCRFLRASTTINITPPTSAAADYDVGIQVINCMFIGGGGNDVDLGPTGAAAFKPGGILVTNCSHFGAGSLIQTRVNSSTTFPCIVSNCLMYGGGNAALNANAAGQITESYNLIFGSARTNVTAGAGSISDGTYAAIPYGIVESVATFETLVFGALRTDGATRGFGAAASPPTLDAAGITRPYGAITVGSFGTATSGGAKTLTDTGKTWGTNVWAGFLVKILSGTGSGEVKSIASNTATALTVDGNWQTQADNTSVYVIYSGDWATSGKATSGGATTLTDSGAAWGTNMWQTLTVEIMSGTGSGQTRTISSNTATVLTVSSAWGTNPDNTSVYNIYRATNINTLDNAVGAYEAPNTGIKETTTVRTGATAFRIQGPGLHDFQLAVDAVATTITVYGQFDAAYAGTKPSMNIVNGTEAGVSAATATMTGGSGAWEQLSLTFTPTAKGIITIRLLSSSTAPTGTAFFDDFAVA